jgi:hypothetical protein
MPSSSREWIRAAEGLRQHHRQPALDQLGDALARQLLGVAGLVGHQRVEHEQQVDAAVQQQAAVHGLLQRAVDEVAAVDLHRWVEAGQGGAGLHRAADGHMVPARCTEGYGVAGVEVGGHQQQRALEVAEVVAATGQAEHGLELGRQRVAVEQPGRQRAAQALQCAEQRAALDQHLPGRLTQQRGQAAQARRVLAPVGVEQDRRVEVVGRCRAVLDEAGAELTRRDAVGQAGTDDAAGADAQVAVAGREVQALDALLERAQRPDLVDGAQRTAAGQRQSDAGVRGAMRGHGMGTVGSRVARGWPELPGRNGKTP